MDALAQSASLITRQHRFVGNAGAVVTDRDTHRPSIVDNLNRSLAAVANRVIEQILQTALQIARITRDRPHCPPFHRDRVPR